MSRILLVDRGPGFGRAALVVRLAAGGVIAAFGVGKFIRHAAEAGAFETFGIPFPDATTYVVGAIELGGGFALVVGLLVRPVALVLAGNFLVAIATAGRVEGGPIHLVLAPALLGSMVFLLWAGPGLRAIDGRLRRGQAQPAARF